MRHSEQEVAAALIGTRVRDLGCNQRHYWDGTREIGIGYEPEQPPHASHVPAQDGPGNGPGGTGGNFAFVPAWRRRRRPAAGIVCPMLDT
jgi:hypothetical protein